MADRNIKKWKEVIKLRMLGLTCSEVGKLTNLTRARVSMIMIQAKAYAKKYDDELAGWICNEMAVKK